MSQEVSLIKSLGSSIPVIHPTAFVSEAAYVVGNVEIGEGSSVWPGAVVRGDMGKVTIGRYTNIQDNSIVHGDANVFIGDSVVIAHRVLCHGMEIGDGCLIGNGAIVNDGVKIGKNTIIGSGAMVVENMEIPSGSIVMGIPARVRGEVQQKHLDLQKWLVGVYSDNAQRYKSDGNLE